jgi:hypothetical protein
MANLDNDMFNAQFPVDEKQGPCWKGYKQVGMKMKNGKEVPNCVPIDEILDEKEGPCWDGYEMVGMKMKDGREVPNCVPVNENEIYEFCSACLVEYIKEHANLMMEAEYQGRKVKLGKPMQGDVKKFKVYVKDPKTGNVKKVNFGDKSMRIKKSNPGRRKNFRARHNCDSPGPRTKARYWSCRKW